MYLFELIDQAEEFQAHLWPMTKVFIQSEQEHLIEVFRLKSITDELGTRFVIVE